MKTYFSFFFISLIAALIVTPWTRNLGIRFGVLDRPNLRKIHQGEIPRLGGVAILAATVLPFIGFLFYSNLLWEQIRLFWQPLSGLALGSLLVFSVGLLDDRYRLSPWPKLAAEILAALVAVAFGLRIEFLTQPFGWQMDLSWLSLPLSVFWLVGITNAFNLADGLDGLATGIATFAALILFFMTYAGGYSVAALLAIALAGAALGFLRYNFYPATIFLGDSGSLFLGFYLGGLSLWASEKSTITFALLIPIVALGLPLADMLYAVLRRWIRGVPIKQADREHIHHKLMDMGFAQRPTVLILYGVNVLLVILAGLLLMTRNSLAAYILVLLGAALVIGSRILGYFRFSRFVRHLIHRWKDLQQSKYVTFRAHLLRKAFEKEGSLDGRWDLAGDLWSDLGFRRVRFIPGSSQFPTLDWSAIDPSEPAGRENELILTLSILGGQGSIGSIEFTWLSNTPPLPAGLDKILSVMANDFARDISLVPLTL
jgi:UDP-GlcNAc:undecaprenyl-phosphate GlcNAc-1-phosphate transferase